MLWETPLRDRRAIRRNADLLVTLDRRDFLVSAGVAALTLACAPARALLDGGTQMYGLIGRLTAVPGQRDTLIEILLGGVSGMPGCLSYVVARDTTSDDALWVTEVWESQEDHQASLGLPSVQEAIAKGRPLIAGFGPERFETEPIGGHGLASSR